MIFELLEMLYMFLTGKFLYWPINFLIFLIGASLVRGIYARQYKPYSDGLKREEVKVSVVIPEYKEDIETLEKCIKSAKENNPDEVILLYEDDRPEVKNLVKKYNIKGIDLSHRRLGKRGSLAMGWLMAKGDIIIQLDSDTILEKGAIDEIIKPFKDPLVVRVQGHPFLFKTGSKLAYVFGQVIELSRDIVCKMLDKNLIVIDGKLAAYRRSFLVSIVKDFLIDRWGKRKILVGDDRALTYLANIMGYKTVYQSTALAKSAAQPTLYRFILQQLRWARSGYLYFLKDIKSGLFFKASRRYRFQMITYLFAPLSLLISIIQTLVMNVQIVNEIGELVNSTLLINVPLIIYSLAVFIVGSVITFNVSITSLGIKYSEIRNLSLNILDYILIPMIGLFIIFPTYLYAMLTYKEVTSWLTR
ncbi:N-acetylglucosaminyltransferase [Sulfolobus sp. E3]|nr:N-acetylglucosaminyltransferase [Sulfolobus sp. E3]